MALDPTWKTSRDRRKGNHVEAPGRRQRALTPIHSSRHLRLPARVLCWACDLERDTTWGSAPSQRRRMGGQHMETLTWDDLNMLIENRSQRALSLYIPTDPTGAATKRNRIRFKNALSEAEDLWEKLGEGATAEKMLKPARELLENTPFWSNQSDGLAVFVSPDTFQCYRLPVHFHELVVVADRFQLKPLISLLQKDALFLVLALSLERVRLLECTFQQVRELDTEAFPSGVKDTIRYDEIQKQVQFHTGTRSGDGPARRRAMYHGQGAAGDDTGIQVVRYCQDIDDALKREIGSPDVMLVLAGLDELVAVFREVTDHKRICDSAVKTNPDDLGPWELHRRAWTLVEPHFEKEVETAAQHYRRLAETSNASDDLRRIVPASVDGRVKYLFVTTGTQRWGRFDAENDTLDLHDKPSSGDGDLLDLAAIHALQKGGTVYALPREEMPTDTSAVAVFRY
ncbi:MAG: hypothetical protein R6V85_08380 [Polyangia bacterium]